jgi:hypothetical protein
MLRRLPSLPPAPERARLGVESLEDRCVPSLLGPTPLGGLPLSSLPVQAPTLLAPVSSTTAPLSVSASTPTTTAAPTSSASALGSSSSLPLGGSSNSLLSVLDVVAPITSPTTTSTSSSETGTSLGSINLGSLGGLLAPTGQTTTSSTGGGQLLSLGLNTQLNLLGTNLGLNVTASAGGTSLLNATVGASLGSTSSTSGQTGGTLLGLAVQFGSGSSGGSLLSLSLGSPVGSASGGTSTGIGLTVGAGSGTSAIIGGSQGTSSGTQLPLLSGSGTGTSMPLVLGAQPGVSGVGAGPSLSPGLLGNTTLAVPPLPGTASPAPNLAPSAGTGVAWVTQVLVIGPASQAAPISSGTSGSSQDEREVVLAPQPIVLSRIDGLLAAVEAADSESESDLVSASLLGRLAPPAQPIVSGASEQTLVPADRFVPPLSPVPRPAVPSTGESGLVEDLAEPEPESAGPVTAFQANFLPALDRLFEMAADELDEAAHGLGDWLGAHRLWAALAGLGVTAIVCEVRRRRRRADEDEDLDSAALVGRLET